MAKKLIFKGRKVALYLADVQMPGGKTVEREIVEHPGAVVIVPILESGTVILEDHRRFTVGESLLEAPAGTLDPGEDPLEAAVRELREETGYAASEMIKLGEFYSSPGVLTELMHAYLARRLRPGPAALEEDEELKVVEIPFDRALEYAETGRIRDAKTIAALFLAREFLKRAGDV